MSMDENLEIITIPKEEAVFWLDEEGRWHNEHGPFEHPKVSAYFHACIQQDADGYYVGQQRDAIYEKVYFRYADTAIFVFGLKTRDGQATLTLNTGQQIDLALADLYVRDDRLYTRTPFGDARFNQKSLMQIAGLIDEEDGELYIRLGAERHKIAGEFEADTPSK